MPGDRTAHESADLFRGSQAGLVQHEPCERNTAMKSSRTCFFVIACLCLCRTRPAFARLVEQPQGSVGGRASRSSLARRSYGCRPPHRRSRRSLVDHHWRRLRFGEGEIWRRVVELAGGPGAKIAVFPTASINPLRSAARASEALRAAGGDPFLGRGDGKDRHRLSPGGCRSGAGLASARGRRVFFTGGEQSRIVQALVDSDGKNTPMLDAIWDVYRRGGAIVGTSAGAAVMSHIMYRDARNVLETLQKGVSMGKEIAYGLGFLDAGWFVEQHSQQRGRFARAHGGDAIAAVEIRRRHCRRHGLGRDRRHARQGDRPDFGAVLMDLSQATVDPAVKGFNLKNARLSYLDRGDELDMATLAITPSAAKQKDTKLDPNSPDFQP